MFYYIIAYNINIYYNTLFYLLFNILIGYCKMRTPVKPVAPDAKTVMKSYQKDKATKYGNEYIEPTQPKWFVSYPFMVSIMAVLQIMAVLYSRKFILFLGLNISEGGLLFLPLVLYTFQIVSECYGWQYARQIVWCNLLVNFLSAVIYSSSVFIPYSSFNHLDLKNSYISLIDTIWVSATVSSVFVFLSDYITSALMCWSRFYWSGKFIWIRIIALHILSEIILAMGGFISLSFNNFSFNEILYFILSSFCARTIISVIMLPIIRFVIWFIQHKIEKVVVFDLHARFNPFQFGINPTDSVQFNATGWDKIDSGKINLKKMSEYYTKDSLEQQHQKQMEEFNKRNSG